MAAAKKKLEVTATKVKDTKGAVMFLADKDCPVTNLYLRKEGWDPAIEHIKITVEEA